MYFCTSHVLFWRYLTWHGLTCSRRGGINGHWWILFSATVPLKPGHCLWGLAFSEKCLAKILPRPPWSTHYLEIQRKIHFKFFSSSLIITLKNVFFRMEIWTFLSKLCFENRFLTSGSGQTEKARTMGIMGIMGIFILTTSQSWKIIPKAYLK